MLLSDHVHIWRKEHLRWEERGQGQGESKGALPSQQSKAIWGHFLHIWRGGGAWGAETNHLYTDHTSRQHEWRHVSCHLVDSNLVVDIQIYFLRSFIPLYISGTLSLFSFKRDTFACLFVFEPGHHVPRVVLELTM